MALPEPITRLEKYWAAILGKIQGGGSSITVEALTVTQNGTTTAPSGKAYSPVTTNVPNSYGASDEGKVVNNGALVAQTAHAPVTANGTIDTTLYNSVPINVPASAPVLVAPRTVGDGYVAYNFSVGVANYAVGAIPAELAQQGIAMSFAANNPIVMDDQWTDTLTTGSFDGTGYRFATDFISSDRFPSAIYAVPVA